MDTTEDSESLFSYGTLQSDAVQLNTFGRKLIGAADSLDRYRETTFEVQNPDFVAASGTKYHRNVEFTGDDSDCVVGMVFQVTRKELEQADIYEAAASYKRVKVQLKSGISAWVYVGDAMQRKLPSES